MDIGALIGGAIAGGAAGAGGAAKNSLFDMQQAGEKEDLMKHEQEIIGMREMALQKSQQEFTGGENDKSRALTSSEGDKGRATQIDMNTLNNKTSSDNANLQANTSITTTGMNNRTTLAAEQMRVVAAHAAAMQTSYTTQPDQDGNLVAINNRTAQAQPVLIDGKQVRALKNVSSSDQLLASTFSKIIVNPNSTPDEVAAAQKNLSDIASGKGPGSTPTSVLNPEKQKILIKAAIAARSGDPAAVAKYDTIQEQYDTASKQLGAAKQYMAAYDKSMQQVDDPNIWKGGTSPSSTTQTPGTGVPGTPPLPSGGVNAGMTANPFGDAPVNKPPLINGSLPPSAPVPQAAPPDVDQQIAASNAALQQRGTAQPQVNSITPTPAPAAMPISNTQQGNPLITGVQQGMVLVNGRLVPAGTLGGPTQ